MVERNIDVVDARGSSPLPPTMIILGIETSCDETALALIDANGSYANPRFDVLSNLVLSQVKMHEQYGGVFPNLAKREHARNLVPLFEKLLQEARTLSKLENNLNEEEKIRLENIEKLLVKEPELFASFKETIIHIEKPNIDAIGVTYGPGLEPALWVGLNFAKALSLWWDIPFVPMNHMEGHIASVLLDTEKAIEFPALALLISGGHTELVQVNDWTEYEIMGQTRDDALGEAFDKVARMLVLPYPGGPHLSKLARDAREAALAGEARLSHTPNPFTFPRPMIHSKDLDFSFAGLKTSVLYTLKKIPEVTEEIKSHVAWAFEDAVTDVLVSKTKKAIEALSPKTLIVGGGVIANQFIRDALLKLSKETGTTLLVPDQKITGDNALMIAFATYIRIQKNPEILELNSSSIRVQGNLRL